MKHKWYAVGFVFAVGGVSSLFSSLAYATTNDALLNEAGSRFVNAWPWYVTRGSGLAAAILLVILIISGIGLVTGYTYRVLEPLKAWAAHKAIGYAFTVSTIIHVGSLLFDKYAPFSVLDVLVPFVSKYKQITLFGMPVGSLYTALGILAFYIIILVTLTSIFWVKKRANAWRIVHYGSYLALVAVFFHALFMGTDTTKGIGKGIWIGGGVILLVVIGVRLWHAGTKHRD
jgi:predicted ferric reductase